MDNQNKKHVGYDKHNNELFEGDICKFEIVLAYPVNEWDSRGNRKYVDRNTTLYGKIIYDDESYAYAFETNCHTAPVLVMHCINECSIEKTNLTELPNAN